MSPIRLQWTLEASPAPFPPSLSRLTEDEAEAIVERHFAEVAQQAGGEVTLTADS